MTKDPTLHNTEIPTCLYDCKNLVIKDRDGQIRVKVKYRIETVDEDTEVQVCTERTADGLTVGPLYIVRSGQTIHRSYAAHSLYDTLYDLHKDQDIGTYPHYDTALDIVYVVLSLMMTPESSTAESITDYLTDKFFIFGPGEENIIKELVDRILDCIVDVSAEVRP